MCMSGHTPWRDIKRKHKEPTEKTPQGFEVPVPKRSEVLANLKKLAQPSPKQGGTKK